MSDQRIPSDRHRSEVAPTEVPGLRGLLFVAIAVVVAGAPYLGRSVRPKTPWDGTARYMASCCRF